MKPNFAVSTTVLLSWRSLHDSIHATATEDSVHRGKQYLRRTGAFLPANEEDLFTVDAHPDTTPLWVQNKISPGTISEFLDNRDLMDDTELIFRDIKPYSTVFPIGQCYVSLHKDDLVVKKILSDDAVIMVDSDSDIPRNSYDRVFESLVCNDTVVTLSRSRSLKEAFWKSKTTGETIKVERLVPHETIYVEYSSKDHDPYKLGSQYTEDVVVVDEGGLGTRHLEEARRSPIAPPTTLDNSLPFNQTNEVDHRNLQQSCLEYRRVQVALYIDSYFCELPQVNDEPFVDRPTEGLAHASSVFAEASAFFELFCVKLEISSAMIKCDKSRDDMYPLVSATDRSICDDTVFKGFREWVRETGNRAFPGDIKHLFTGRKYTGSRCIGRAYIGSVCRLPWNTGVNEISVNTINSNLFAHEAAHNLGARHDSNDGIMLPSSGSCSTCEFTQISQDQINSKLDERSCVDRVPAGGPPVPSPVPPVKPTRTPSRGPVIPSPSLNGKVTGLVLINSKDNSEIRGLKDGDEINLYGMQTTDFNLRADTSGIVESVRFNLDGQSGYKTDNVMPYALGGEDKGDYYPVRKMSNLGFHTVTATPFSANRGKGEEGKPMTVTFRIINVAHPPTSAPTGTPIAPITTPVSPTPFPDSSVTMLVLIDATDNSEVHILSDGDLISLNDLQTTDLNIRAYTRGAVSSVKFDLDGSTGFKTDNAVPYALGGEVDGYFYPVSRISKIGLHTVTATPFSENRGAGQEGMSMTVNFTIKK